MGNRLLAMPCKTSFRCVCPTAEQCHPTVSLSKHIHGHP